MTWIVEFEDAATRELRKFSGDRSFRDVVLEAGITITLRSENEGASCKDVLLLLAVVGLLSTLPIGTMLISIQYQTGELIILMQVFNISLMVA